VQGPWRGPVASSRYTSRFRGGKGLGFIPWGNGRPEFLLPSPSCRPPLTILLPSSEPHPEDDAVVPDIANRRLVGSQWPSPRPPFSSIFGCKGGDESRDFGAWDARTLPPGLPFMKCGQTGCTRSNYYRT
jgi:hypothetical protein